MRSITQKILNGLAVSEIEIELFRLALDVVMGKRTPRNLSHGELEELFVLASPSACCVVDDHDIYCAAEGIVGDAFRFGLNGHGRAIDRMMEHCIKRGIIKLK